MKPRTLPALMLLAFVVLGTATSFAQDTTSPRIIGVDGSFPHPAGGGFAGTSEVEVAFDEPVTLAPGAVTGWTLKTGLVTNLQVDPAGPSESKIVTFPMTLNEDHVLVIIDGLGVIDSAGNLLAVKNTACPTKNWSAVTC